MTARVIALDHERADRQYLNDLRPMATRDLLDFLEHMRFLAVEYANLPSSRAFAEYRIDLISREVLRRQKLVATGDPLAPPWPKRADLTERIAQVKELWPIDHMVSTILGVQLQRYGRERARGLCPFHDERTPSFTVFLNEARAYCFGCQRGGDVLDLVGHYLGHHRTIDQLETLEGFAGVMPPGRTRD